MFDNLAENNLLLIGQVYFFTLIHPNQYCFCSQWASKKGVQTKELVLFKFLEG